MLLFYKPQPQKHSQTPSEYTWTINIVQEHVNNKNSITYIAALVREPIPGEITTLSNDFFYY